MPKKLFFPAPPLPDGSFTVRGIGFREPMPPSLIDRPAGTGDFLLMFFHTAARAGLGPEAPLLPGGTLFVWKPGDRHYYGHGRKRYLHSWVHCSGRRVEALLGEGAAPCRTPLALRARPFLDFLQALHRELAEERPDPAIAANLLENWTRDAARRLRPLRPGGGALPAPLRAARDHIDRHYAQPLALADLARLANWSPSHFSAEFRRHFGTPPVGYLIERRLHHACYLLQDVNLSVAEVAKRVGYDDLFHFSKLFKRRFAHSPRAYRNRRNSLTGPNSA